MCTLSSFVSLTTVGVSPEPITLRGASTITSIFCTFISPVLLGQSGVSRNDEDSATVHFIGICPVLWRSDRCKIHLDDDTSRRITTSRISSLLVELTG